MHRTSWAWMSGAIVALKIMTSLFKTTCRNRQIKAGEESIIVARRWGRILWDYKKGVWNSWLHEERSERLESELLSVSSSLFSVSESSVWEALKGLERASRREQFDAAPQSEQKTCGDVSRYWAVAATQVFLIHLAVKAVTSAVKLI